MFKATDKSGEFTFSYAKLGNVVEWFALGRNHAAKLYHNGLPLGEAAVMAFNAQVDAVGEGHQDDKDRTRELRMGRDSVERDYDQERGGAA